VLPATANVEKGNQENFFANVQVIGGASTTVTWSIQGQQRAGTTIDSDGILSIAPDESATSITVKATSDFETTKFGTAIVTVTDVVEVISVTVSPATVSVQKGTTQQFTATVTAGGGASTTVTWSISGQLSPNTLINSTGFLTVAADETALQIMVVATSDFDGMKSGTATVTVTDDPVTPEVLSITVAPATSNVEKGQSYGFTATVTAVGGADESVTWSLRGQLSVATQIDGNGVLFVGADETAPEITVVATSVFDSHVEGSAKATVNSIGIADVVLSGITIYPTLFVDYIRIDHAENATVRMVDISGKTIGVFNIRSNTQTLTLYGLPAGFYLLHISKDGKTSVVKTIKK
jgi:uncharacterized protein YjdB